MQGMVRTRIPPSPTGQDIHVGNLYTALMNWAFAKKHDGKFIIRIEDTDRTRFQEGAEERILASVRAFGLHYDEGPDIGGPFAPYRQSERLPLYKKYALELIEKGAAYYCFCTKERLDQLREQQVKEKKTPRYDKHCLSVVNQATDRIAKGEKYVIRLNVPKDEQIVFTDVIRDTIIINTNDVDDQVLLKSDGFPTYHLGVVVDDHVMEISHVIRAEEWISSTPKHVLLYKAFGWDLPIFAHMPILRNPDKSKLSKRKNPVWASWYLAEGFLPEAMLNYLALLGWSHPEEKEIFSLDEFITLFDLKDIKAVGPIFDLVKLKWVNQQYIQNKSDQELKDLLLDFSEKATLLPEATIDALVPLLKTRMETLRDFEELTEVFFSSPLPENVSEQDKQVSVDLITAFSALEEWEHTSIFAAMKEILLQYHIRMPVLYTLLTGKGKGLPLPETIAILGKEQTLARLEKVIEQ